MGLTKEQIYNKEYQKYKEQILKEGYIGGRLSAPQLEKEFKKLTPLELRLLQLCMHFEVIPLYANFDTWFIDKYKLIAEALQEEYKIRPRNGNMD